MITIHHPTAVKWKKLATALVTSRVSDDNGASKNSRLENHTVDGRNPAPLGMYKTL